MSDGAHLGVDAQRALDTVLGGAPEPTEEEGMTAAQMAEWIMASTRDTATSYEETARYAAKLILEYLLADPQRATIPTENVYQYDDNGKMVWPAVVLTPGLYDVMKADGVPIDDLGLTGFMWGWAVNAARRCVELPAVPNPAILTLGGD